MLKGKEKRKKKERDENAREARLKRWLQSFEKRTNTKWHERKNSLQNKLTQARKYRGIVIAKKKKKKTVLCCIHLVQVLTFMC